MDDLTVLTRQITTEHLLGLSGAIGVLEHAIGEVLGVKTADVLAVEPVKFGDVENRPAGGDARPVEAGHEGVEVLHLLALGDRRECQQLQEVAQRLGQVTLFTEPHQPSSRVLALGDLGLVGVAQQWHVREPRHLPTQPLVEQQVLRRRRDPLLTTNDGVDAHEMVVDDDGHVVRRESVGLEDDLVIGTWGVDLAANEIVELQLDVLRDEHAHDGCLGETRQLGPLLLGHAQTHAVVTGVRGLRGRALLAQCLEPLLGAPATVGVTRLDELVDERLVGVQTLRLPVRFVRSTDPRRLVGGQTQPVEGLVDLFLRTLHQTVAVGVLDAQHELAAGALCPSLVEQRHVGRTDVRVSGGRGATRVRAGCNSVMMPRSLSGSTDRLR